MTTSFFYDITCPFCKGTDFDGPEGATQSDVIVCETCKKGYRFDTLLKIAKVQALQKAREYVDSQLMH